MADNDESLSEFERSLLSRMNKLKPTSQTLDRRKTSQPVQTGPWSRTTDDVKPAISVSSRQPQSGGGLSFQEELMKRRATLRGGGGEGGHSPAGQSTCGNAGGDNVPLRAGGDKTRKEAPVAPGRLPTGKKKVPVPPSLKSNSSENNSVTGKSGGWEPPRRNKVSDMASKMNFQGQDSQVNTREGSSTGNHPDPPAMPAPKPPKPKATQKLNQSDILQKFSARSQPNEWQNKRLGSTDSVQDQSSIPSETKAPPPPSFPPPQASPQEDNVPPPLPGRGPASNKWRQIAAQNMEQKLNNAQAETEAPPPPAPKRMESCRKLKPAPPPPQDDPRAKFSRPLQRSSENLSGGGETHSGSVRRNSGPRVPSEASARKPEKSGVITPVGSSSESDYSGDGHVRRNRQLEILNSKGSTRNTDQAKLTKHNSLRRTSSGNAKPPRSPDPPIKKGNTKRSLTSEDTAMADSGINFPKSLKLADFIANYAHLLPIKVQILNDVSTGEDGAHISKNEILFLQLLKKSGMVVLNAETDMYLIPMNSKIKFGLIYNPIEADENVSSYMKLPTAGDIMKLKQLPLVVTAMSRSDGGAPDKSVAEKEILFVKGVVRGSGGPRGQQELHAVNLNDEDKFLGPQCAGNFTTDPHHMKMHLSSLLANDIDMPQYVILYPDRELRSLLPQNLSNCPVLLASTKEEVSVLASRGDLMDETSHTEQLVELSSDVSVSIKPIKLTVTEKNFLKRVSTVIHSEFKDSNTLKISQVVHESSNALQSYFYRSVLEGELSGISLELPASCLDKGTLNGSENNLASRSSLDESRFSSSEVSRSTIQDDTVSISSHNSGNLSILEPQSSSSLALNAIDASTYDAEAEEDKDPDDFYEDISELQEDYMAEKMKIEESKKKQETTETTSVNPAPSTSKGFSLFKSSKDKKDKKKKSKKKEGDKFSEEYSEHPLPTPATNLSIPPTHNEPMSSSELYVDVNPIEQDCLSDENYEDCSFSEGTGNSREVQPPPLPTSLPPGMAAPPLPDGSPMPPPLPTSFPPILSNFDQMKKKIMQRPPVVDKIQPDIPLISPTTSDLSQDGEYADAEIVTLPEHVIAKKMEMKDKQFAMPPTHPPLGESPIPPQLPPPMKTKEAGELSLSGLRDQVTHLHGEVENLKAQVSRLTQMLEKLVPGAGAKSKELSVEDNLNILKRMSASDIIAMLDAMDLSKYKAAFTREGINGIVFSDMDDATLKEDLKVSSKLHRSRLLQIARGKNPIPR